MSTDSSQVSQSAASEATSNAISSSSSSEASSSSSLATAKSIEQQHNNNPTTTSKTSTTTPTPTKKRTRATAEQLAVLEDTFAVNVSPNSKLRKQLAERLQMSERSIQIWFQNRRAKVKHMQKRAQMQMQQASIRAQLYHYHQQQYGAHPYGSPHHQQHQHHQHGPPLMPLQPHHHHHQQQQQQQYYCPQPYPTTSPSTRVPLPRAQSVDTIQQHHPVQQQPTSTTTTTTTPPPSHLYYPPTHPHHQQQWPDTTTVSSPTSSATPTHPYNNSTIPTLVPVPDAGPTAMLTTSDFGYAPTTPAATPPAPTTMANDLWCTPDAFDRTQSVGLAVSDPTTGELVSPVRALSDPIVTTIDPSSLMMTPPATSTTSSSGGSESSQTSSQEHQHVDEINNNNNNNNTSLNATTLTIGSWHRLKLRSNDLLCVYQPDRRMFAWHIADNGSLFRMEISLEAVASIEYIAGDCDVLADVHFDISEPPQFYMQQQKEEDSPIGDDEQQQEQQWIQCSDFTEGKQASRFFRHSLKGVAHHMKQEFLNLMDKHEETRRLVRFIETPIPTALTAAYQPTTAADATSIIEDPMFHSQPSSSYMYWNPMAATAATPFMAEPCSFLS
ncbi:hypothetical protein BDB00DRAFT_928661 [Zychaea mexicana]|uniref:uncharacterized protein n=1 Tax=Zychaea mexicana TaxID=64656 RepID=UPI0022FF184F|nr:uncharacterized protein BDB00DRAFT_928661 [Zychaea mexicana]KAI9493944.1 hypothetical protein BDB00DRAFT_928661 [Zychaea mexicana]